jgi:hypothetical protein
MVFQLLASVELHPVDYAVIAVDLALTVVLAGARGFTVRIYPRDGTTCYRYGPVTVLLWCLSFALRIVLGVYAARYGAAPLATSGVVLLVLGLTLLIQNAIVVQRRSVSTPPARMRG